MNAAQVAAEARRARKGRRNLRLVGPEKVHRPTPPPEPLHCTNALGLLEAASEQPRDRLDDLGEAAAALAETVREAAHCVRLGSGDLRVALAPARAAAKQFIRASARLEGLDLPDGAHSVRRLLALHLLLVRTRGHGTRHFFDAAWAKPVDQNLMACAVAVMDALWKVPPADHLAAWEALVEFRRLLRDVERDGDLVVVHDWLRDMADSGADAYADHLLGVFWDLERDPIVLMGRDAGHVVEALAARGAERLIVYDPENKPVDKALVIPDPYQARAAVVQWKPHRHKARFAAVRTTDRTIPDADQKVVCDVVSESIDAMVVCGNTIDLFGEVWSLQGMENLPLIAANPTIGMYRDVFKVGERKTPAVIVATGPSLSKNVHLLRELKGRALIITFSHTLRALEAAGVVPDVVLALDPEDLRYHFDGCDTTKFEALVTGATIHPGVLRLPSKRLITFAANAGIDGWIYRCIVGGKTAAEGEQHMISTGGSVACSALALALLWGCGPILFVGQDLAYTGDKVYADGSPDGDATITRAEGEAAVIGGWSDGYAAMASVGGARQQMTSLTECEGYDGGTVPTSVSFNMYRKWIEAFLAQHKVEAWNCTEGGAKIANTEQVPLAEGLRRITEMGSTCDAGAAFDARRAARTFDPSARAERMLVEVGDMLGKVQLARSSSARALELYGCEPGSPERAELEQVAADLERLVNEVPYIIQAQQRHIVEQDDVEGDPDAQREAFLRNHNLIVEAADKMVPVLERAGETLRGMLAAA